MTIFRIIHLVKIIKYKKSCLSNYKSDEFKSFYFQVNTFCKE